jgi:hypothetical protein
MTLAQWKLEKQLKTLNYKCSINSGMGERYEYWHNQQKAALAQLAAYRPLTVYEVLCLGFDYGVLVELIRQQEQPTVEYQGQTIRMVREMERIRA